MKYLYYPGCCCALKDNGKAYEESLLAIFNALKVDFEELDDWNCCGATVYMAVDETKSFALAARNLALAEKQDPESKKATIVPPCSACCFVLDKAKRYMEEYPEIGEKIRTSLQAGGLSYAGRTVIRHPLDVLVNDIGLDRIAGMVKRPLKGLRVACYYGCLLVRPYASFDDQHNPMTMDRLLRAVGAEPIDWPLKTRCCGGSLTGTIEEVGLRLGYIILKEAQRRGADVIATACPICMCNLECFQRTMSREFKTESKLPAAYFTQLVGFAMGLDYRQIGLHRNFRNLPDFLLAEKKVHHVLA
ncbi:MAG: CoB--CoM heterodisulfide reductase iron-sulfur subunit B family protein [Acidobacteria bacterium]|nr:CoB--CoM heterodisulfide reductase iron-sulfur subunit B family protein [Acidobacteriota bacterium]